MKLARQAKSQWTRVFRALRPSELLLLYARAVPRGGVAVWHTHPGNDQPHAHIEDHNHSHPHESGDHDRHHPHEAHHQRSEGHWHFAIPARQVGGLFALLIVAFSTIWLAVSNLAAIFPSRESCASARAPPLPA